MKDVFGIFVRLVISWILRILYIFPIKSNRIFFQSYEKAVGYCCNPKYICEFLKKNYPDQFELVWVFAEPEKFQNIEKIKKLKLYSIKAIIYQLTSKVIVINVTPPSFIPKRKGQYLIETWHGGGAYKRVGLSRREIPLIEKWSREHGKKKIDLFLSASQETTRASATENYHYEGEVLKCGLPRNDFLLDNELTKEIQEKVKNELKVQGYVVLYAPTYRMKEENPGTIISFSEVVDALERRVGKKVFILVRAHRFNHAICEAENNNTVIKDVSDYPDMQELLCAADMLITDYSSCIWDFALLERPCLLYVPDLEEYRKDDRGFCTPIEEWPGNICQNVNELSKTIETLDVEECAVKARKHLETLGSYENGTATQQVCNKIVEYCFGRK